MRSGLRKLTPAGVAALLGTIALLAAGCGGGSTSSGPGNLAAKQVFNYNFPNGSSKDFATLDPDIVGDASSAGPIQMIYDGLVVQDKNLAPEDWGAQSIDVSSDGLTYTFHLRSGQEFSNGTAVTADDYAYSMNRSMNPCLASVVSYYLSSLVKDGATFSGQNCTNGTITAAKGQTAPVLQTVVGDSIVVRDPMTLVVTLAKPAAYFLEALTYPTSYAIDPSVVGSDITSEKWLDTLSQGATGQGGSGMFYVSSWDHNAGKLVLKQNPHWWGLTQGKKPYLTEVDFTVFPSQDTSYAAYQTGEFDDAIVPASQQDQAKTQPDFHQVGQLTFEGLVWNWNVPPFNNLDARLAFCEAINRDQINASILHGVDVPEWNIVPMGMPGYNAHMTGPDGITSTTGDQAKAAQHWQAYLATLNGKAPPPISLNYDTGSSTVQAFFQAYQATFQQVLGVTVKLHGEDFNTYYKDLNVGNFQASRDGWLDDYPDPQDFLTLLFATGVPENSFHATVPQADTLMLQADKDPNPTTRFAAYNQAEQLLVNNGVYCPVFQTTVRYRVRGYVHNWGILAGGQTVNDSWVATYITQH